MLDLPFIQTIETIQDEPALDIALPQVFVQPTLDTLRRGRLRHLEWLVAQMYQRSAPVPASSNGSSGHVILGQDYQAIVNEFQPLFTWGLACWDYLLTTEGCRFVRRRDSEKVCCRGNYRAVTDKDFSRLLHRIFRACIIEFAQTATDQPLSEYLRATFWPAIVTAYRQLDEPEDPRQRRLTAYSYLRCTPYTFLNRFHESLVTEAVNGLPRAENRAITGYFFNFYTLEATADGMQLSAGAIEELLRRGLTALWLQDRLVSGLLRQMERY